MTTLRFYDYEGGIIEAEDAPNLVCHRQYDRRSHRVFPLTSARSGQVSQLLTWCGGRAETIEVGEVDCPECLAPLDHDTSTVTLDKHRARSQTGT